MPGLLQTPAYARALFESMGFDAETVDARVEARIKRQSILDRAEPVSLWVVLDDAVLRRHVGSEPVMHEQLLYLAQRARLHNAGVQIVPADNGANAGCVGALTVASGDGFTLDVPNEAWRAFAARLKALSPPRARAAPSPRRMLRPRRGKPAERLNEADRLLMPDGSWRLARVACT